MTGLTIIVPTVGRETLAATLASIHRQTVVGDRVIVAADGPRPRAREIFHDHRWPDWEFFEFEFDGHWGHGLRNSILDQLEPGTHVVTIDDDDVYEDGALDLFREARCDRPVIFRMAFGRAHAADGLVVWQRPHVQYGDIGTPMILAPVCRARFGLEYHGDFTYVTQLVEELGEPIWRPEVVARIRPTVVEDT